MRYVVTGAASGIGHAVAEQLLRAGAEVYCLDRNTPTAAVTRHVEVDLSNPRSIDAAVEQLEGEFDGLMMWPACQAPPQAVVANAQTIIRHGISTED
jgi:NAD(P)-dependent dehydrogenase (short-subunit alcohol dehydrogenase family)